MAKIRGNRHNPKVRHKSVTASANKVYQYLLRQGFVVNPGMITSSGTGGQLRITLTYEPRRTCITVFGQGVQDLLLYGAFDRAKLEEALKHCTETPLHIRDRMSSVT